MQGSLSAFVVAMKNVFLTGERGVGKSTIINRYAGTLDYLPMGFQTILANPVGNGFEAVYIKPFGAALPCGNELASSHGGIAVAAMRGSSIEVAAARGSSIAVAAVRDRESREMKACKNAFDVTGAEILRLSRVPGRSGRPGLPGLVIMDELGFLENEAFAFQGEVFKCLECGIPVLGVLKAVSTPFLDTIRVRPDVRILEVTPENRERIFWELMGE